MCAGHLMHIKPNLLAVALESVSQKFDPFILMGHKNVLFDK